MKEFSFGGVPNHSAEWITGLKQLQSQTSGLDLFENSAADKISPDQRDRMIDDISDYTD